MDLIQLARTLIDIPSVTGEEGPLADYLDRYLQHAGFEVRTQPIEGERRNLLASLDPHPRLAFCTHLDTVPPFFPSEEDGRHLFGRGACDAKGIMAAMITAVLALPEKDRRAVCLLFVVGEETDSIGAKRANEISPGPDYIVVGEPTENKLGKAHKGTLTVKIQTKGRSAHSAFPDRGESAVDGLLDILAILRRTDFGEDPVLGKTTLNIGQVSGGTAPNIIAKHAEATLSLRLSGPPQDSLASIRAAVGSGAEIEVMTQSPPQRLVTLPGYESVVLPFSTDISYLKDYGRPLLIGPGSIRDAHTDREKVEKAELRKSVEIYKDLAGRLLAVV